MKRFNYKSFLAFLPLFLATVLSAQIPNPDFEFWDSVTLNRPLGYRVYGQTFKTQGYMSNFAVRIQKNHAISEGPGAIIYGNPDQGFTGGIQASARPDSAVVFLKRHLVAGDSAWFLVHFKRNGVFISEDIFKIGGTDSNTFRRFAFKINYMDTGISDSLVVGLASSDPNGDFEESFLIADSIHFKGGTGTVSVPNANMEQWHTIGFNNLRGWLTTNAQVVSGNAMPVSKTADHAFTSTACKIQNVDLGNGQFAMGYIMAGRQGNDGPKPGFAVQGRDSLLYCSYKCFPNGDTINIAIMMFRNDTMMGMGRFTQSYTINSWSQIVIPIDYWHPTMVPDSAVIYCSAFQGGSSPHGNTVLFVDGLSLNSPKVGLHKKWVLPLRVFPNPASDRMIISDNSGFNDVHSVCITNVTGQKVYVNYLLSPDGKSLELNIDGLNGGLWFYEINSANGTRTGRFVINR